MNPRCPAMRSPKAFFLLPFVCSLLLLCPLRGFTAERDNWPLYKGAWFQIKYPPNFTVKPSLKSRTAVNGYDSAFFASPDQAVEFYIFSPQWNGEPEDIGLEPNKEALVSENFGRDGKKQLRMVTVKSKAGTYLRSWVDIQDPMSNTRWAFGIKYKDRAAYNKYKRDYLLFKSSLKQFAD